MTLQDAKALITLCIDEGMKQGVLKKDEPKELFNYLDKYFTDTGKMTSDSSEVLKDLEEASSKFATRITSNGVSVEFLEEKLSFQEGAKWQKEQDEREQADLFTIIALDAAQRAKEQMMQGALNGWLDEDNEPPYDLNVVCEEKIPFGKFKHGDKVRIIIVKKD